MARETKREKLVKLVAVQRQWMQMRGGDEAGYVKFYGSATDENHYGNGGEAIYKADANALAYLEGELARCK